MHIMEWTTASSPHYLIFSKIIYELAGGRLKVCQYQHLSWYFEQYEIDNEYQRKLKLDLIKQILIADVLGIENES